MTNNFLILNDKQCYCTMQSSIFFLGYLTNSNRRRFEAANMFYSCFFLLRLLFISLLVESMVNINCIDEIIVTNFQFSSGLFRKLL